MQEDFGAEFVEGVVQVITEFISAAALVSGFRLGSCIDRVRVQVSVRIQVDLLSGFTGMVMAEVAFVTPEAL